eukprot:46604-Heterocapsa_arctica.AAC.1
MLASCTAPLASSNCQALFPGMIMLHYKLTSASRTGMTRTLRAEAHPGITPTLIKLWRLIYVRDLFLKNCNSGPSLPRLNNAMN